MLSNTPRILCVDDQEDFLVLLDHFLTANDFSVVSAAKGEEALRIAAHERFSAAVLDYAMPEMNGEELALKLRAIYPEMPIVLFSASSHDLPESAFAAVDLTVSKSFPISNLVTVLRKLTCPVEPERRDAARRRVNLDVRVVDEGLRGTAIKAANLSAGGIGLNAALRVPVGSAVDLAFISNSGELLVAIKAEVRHVAPGRTGLSFLEMSEQQRKAITGLCAAG